MSDLDEFRRAKDRWMSLDEQSPLTADQRRRFGGLVYFDEAPDFVLRLAAERIDGLALVEMQTSSGETAMYEEWGRVRFEVDGQPASLMIYGHPATGALFLPFRDATSGDETYAAGRYLEVHDMEDGTVFLDFNYAYSPYCAYNEGYSCPLPPPENRLSVAIRAGERNFYVPAAEHRHE